MSTLPSFVLISLLVQLARISRTESFSIPSNSFLISSGGKGLTKASSPPSTKVTTLAMTIDKPYGSWKSPITSKAITAGSVQLSSLQLDPSSQDLVWLEGRPQEGGRVVLCQYAPDDPNKTDRNGIDVTPKDSYIRTRVHEYGGKSMVLAKSADGSGSVLFYSEFKTQQLMKMKLGEGEEAKAITPEGGKYRFADGVYDETKDRLIMVREDHTNPAPKDVVNEIVAVDANTGEMTVLATGNDFYASPRLSPDGMKLSYVTWNHPNMPWDSTKLYVRGLKDDEAVNEKTSEHTLVDGSDDDTSIMQPLWHPDTGKLFYISDKSGYYNIYQEGVEVSILPIKVDFGGSSPGWRLGQQGYHFLDDGRLVTVYSKEGRSQLLLANIVSSEIATDIEEYGMDHGLPMMFGNIVGTKDNDTFYFIGGGPDVSSSIYQWSLKTHEKTQLACSSTLSIPKDYISTPRQIEFPTTLGTAFGYYYPPTNNDYECTTDPSGPPLLVKAHGGPTACTSTGFNPSIQYWTSRGFAILDVDYGGSTGYGRDYRRRLRGAWGIVDIDDVCAGAEYLVKEGLADPKRLCIDGGSAGGFTTLGALAFRKVFTAGCSLYGVADLASLAGETHKFESRYLDGLVGRYPEEEAIYKERSPIESVDTLSCPILLLQGDEDKIVPPNQSEMMYEALLKKGIPTCLKMYEGEQHGFRKAENIEDSLDSELSFFRQIYGIEEGAEGVKLVIDNL